MTICVHRKKGKSTMNFEKIGVKNRKKVFTYLLFLIVSFIIMTICSQSSFLYPFNNEPDVSCFYTVARSILNGKVLYRDIYEHKGLYLYFIYALAYIIVPTSYRGIYIIEILCSWIFMIFSYKSSMKLINNALVSKIAAVVGGLVIYTAPGFQEGGFAEEFTIPIIAACVYMAVKYYSDIWPKEIPCKTCIIMGVLLACLFWIKYMVLGFAVGLVFFIVISLIKEKKKNLIFKYFAQVICGFVIGSLPVIIYFVINKAFSDMIEVYFVNMLFKYSGGQDNSAVDRLYEALDLATSTRHILFESSLLILLLFLTTVNIKKIFNSHKNDVVRYMFIGTFLVTAYGITYSDAYQSLVYGPFIPFSIVFAYSIIGKVTFEKIADFATDIKQFLDKYAAAVIGFSGVMAMMLYAFGTLDIVYQVVLAFLWGSFILTAANFVMQLFGNKSDGVKSISKYFVPIVACFLSMYFSVKSGNESSSLRSAALIVILYFGLADIVENKDVFVNTLRERTEKMEGAFKRIGINSVLIASVIVCSLIFGNNTEYIMWDFEDTPQYSICKIISESGIENPVIYHYKLLDSGVFNLLETYPQMKCYGWYNIETPEIEETINRYMIEGEADFIITCDTKDEELYEKYTKVYSGKKYLSGGIPYLYLYQHK